MKKLDPQLAFLVDVRASISDPHADPRIRSRYAMRLSPLGTASEVDVLVECSNSIADLTSTGLRVRTRAENIFTGSINVDALPLLSDFAGVRRVEASRPMHPELDLSMPECRANVVHTVNGRRGSGTIVGICDDGFDFTHPCFIDASGRSRVKSMWIQGLVPTAGEHSPPGFGYGVEYDNAAITAALASGAPFTAIRHLDPGNHGTHVAGIAAGNGRAAPSGTYVGVAPEADLVVVVTRSNGTAGLGTSSNTLEAVDYIYRTAQGLGRPCVVNMSLGDNLGPHDGTSVLERGIAALLGAPGRAFVKSAGNAASSRCHAKCTIGTGQIERITFDQPAGDRSMNQIDLWYTGTASLEAELIDPAGTTIGRVPVGGTASATLMGFTQARVDHRDKDPFNNDRRIFVTILPPMVGVIAAGTWTIVLHGIACPEDCEVHGWIQRGDATTPFFNPPHESRAVTISTPGTASEVITVGNYVSRGAAPGTLASSSSRGPTRDGRSAPTLSAPGSKIMSANANGSPGSQYRLEGGTSMAAPHVTGVIALMLEADSTLTQARIRTCLESSARRDAHTGPTPNNDWGHGKLDAVAALSCVVGTA